MNINFLIVCFFLLLFHTSCNSKEKKAEVLLRIHLAKDHKVYVYPISFTGEQKQILDSATIKSSHEEVVFHIPKGEERPFKIKIQNSPLDIFFINDSPEITIEATLFSHNDYSVQNSPATASVKKFLDQQKELGTQLQNLKNSNDSDLRRKSRLPVAKSSFNQNNVTLSDLLQQYINYADTVSSPGAFLYIYNKVDFGKNYDQFKNFILKAAKRFPRHSRIQQLKQQVLQYLKIFEEEYQVGEKIPNIILPDLENHLYSTASLSGKFYLLNFWSSWCNICASYSLELKKAKQKFPPDKFEAVNIAIDSEKDWCRKIVQSRELNWIQLIDEKMWEGTAVQTYKIDSIPFNFLVDPHGIILKKGIPSDSLLYFIKINLK